MTLTFQISSIVFKPISDANQPHKYGSHKPDYHRRRSGVTKSRKAANTNTAIYKEPFADMEIVEQASFTGQEVNEGETLITWGNYLNPKAVNETKNSSSIWYPSDQLNSGMESDTILHLSESGEILKLSRSENSEVETPNIDVTAVLDSIKGDVEYKTVVITDEDDNILQNWNENVTYGSCENGT